MRPVPALRARQGGPRLASQAGRRSFGATVAGLLSAGCGLALAACSSATPSPTAQSTATPAPTETLVPATPGNLPHSLALWLSPRFAPDPETTAGALLLERLAAFEAEHPGVQITVRVKAEGGPGGLRQSLATAGQAAARALPDLAVLGPAALTEAQDLLVELDLPAAALERYEFAEPAGPSALPFAAELELFAYRTVSFDTPPLTWGALFTDTGTFLVPAADPESRFLMAQYLALGGSLDQLDREVLTVALGFLESASSAGALAPSSLDFASSAETWAAFLAGRGEVASAPFSAFARDYQPLDYSAGPLPTSDGRGISLAHSWSWALLNGEPQTQALLAWLSDPEFLARWTHALGLVPTQPEILQRWPDTPETAIASRLVSVAEPLPDPATLASFGPSMAAALRAVLLGELTPQEAAAMAVAGR